MPKLMSPAAVEAFAREGFYSPVRVMPAAEARRYRNALETHEAKTGKPLQGNWRHKMHLLFTWADQLVHQPKVLDAVEDVIGPDILCWTTNFFIKEADSPGFVSWHQDSTYWGLEPDDVVTAWVAFTEVTEENGYMQVIPGSHKVDQLPHVDTFHKDNLLSRGQEIAVEVDKSKAVGLAMGAGEMSLHHIKLVHGSAANRSHDRRIGMSIRYIPTYVRQTKVRDSAMLVRGVAPNCMILVAMSYGSYATPDVGVANALRLMKEGGADVVKMQGGREKAHIIRAIADAGVPVMSHVGMCPHFVHQYGGFKLQGRSAAEALRIVEDGIAIEQAGAVRVEIEGVSAPIGQAGDPSTESLRERMVLSSSSGSSEMSTACKPSSCARRATTGIRSRKRFETWNATMPSGFMCRS